jgi:hypothetical protein
VELILEDTAHRFTSGAAYEADPRNGGSLTSFDKGHGLVDVFAAVSKALPSTVTTAPTHAPTTEPTTAPTTGTTDGGGRTKTRGKADR